jgi:hypothetical protein
MSNQFNISDRAMMVKITSRAWGMSKTDKSASAELNQRKGSKKGKVNKPLVADSRKKAITTIKSDLSDIISKYTLPATGAFAEGFRIVPIGVYYEFLEKVGGVQARMTAFGNQLAYDLEDVKWEARTEELGDLYDENDYPNAEKIRNKFKIECVPFPVPDEVKVPMGQDDLNRLNDQIQAQHTATYNRTMIHFMDSLLKPIKHMSEILMEDKKIHESLHSNIKDVIIMIQKLNLYGNKDIDDLAKKAQELIDDIPLEFYRKSEIIKGAKSKEAKSLAQEIESKMANFDF